MFVNQEREPPLRRQVSALKPSIFGCRRSVRVIALGLQAVAVAAGAVTASAVTAEAAPSQLVPVVGSFSPASGSIGTTVTIKGSGFGGASGVTFGNSATVLPIVKSATSITARVPVSASTGKISVLGPTGTGSSTAKFTVTPGIELSASGGHPAGKVSVYGAGFKAFEAVDLYFDATDEALVTTNGTGNFSGITIDVPWSAVPGTHWISAIGREPGSAAQASYAVSTNWPQLGNTANHTGFNPYENVLSPWTVASIDQDWSFTTGGGINGSPAVVNGVAYVGSDDKNVYAVNAATGTPLWSFAAGGQVLSSPPSSTGSFTSAPAPTTCTRSTPPPGLSCGASTPGTPSLPR